MKEEEAKKIIKQIKEDLERVNFWQFTFYEPANQVKE